MKRTKHLILTLALILLLVAVAVVSASAADATIVDSGTCGNNLTWTLDSDGVLRIRGTGYMSEFKDYKAPWFEMRESINTVVIEDGVTSISTHAFSAFDSLTYVQIGDGLTSIGSFSFAECGNLKKVILGQSVTDINAHAFYKCYELEEINLPDSLDTIRYDAFHFCTSLTSIQLPKSSHNLYIWRYAFGRTAIEELYIPSNVRWSTSDEHTFYGSPNLKRVVIEKGVENIPYYCFDSCPNLQDVYYEGTKEEWNQIYIASGNTDLKSATKHYNYAIPHFPAGYDWETDRWNLYNEGHIISRKNVFYKAYGISLGDAVYNYISNGGNKRPGTDGLCFGYATSTGAYLEKYLDLKDISCFHNGELYADESFYYPPEKMIDIGDIENTLPYIQSLGISWIDMVCYAQMLQSTVSISKECKIHANDLTGLVNAVKAYVNGTGAPVVIGLSSPAHAVYACGYKETETYTEIYLNNSTFGPKMTALKINKNESGNYTSWVCPRNSEENYSSAYDGHYITYCTPCSLLKMLIEDGITAIDGRVNSKKFIYSLDENVWWKVQSTNSNADFYEVQNFQGEENSSPAFWVEQDETDAFIIPSSNTENHWTIANYDLNIGLSVPAETESSVLLNEDRSTIIVNGEKDKEVLISLISEGINGCLEKIEISGLIDSSECMIEKNNNITVTGLNDMTITYSVNDEVVAETTVNVTDGREVTVQVNEETEQLNVEHEHNYDMQVLEDPTCTTDGTNEYTCTICGDTYTEPVPATGEHVPSDAVHENETEATCNVNGSYDEVVYCAECGEELSRETVTIPATGDHADADNDGYCDACEEMMQGGQHCKYCGKIHGGLFGWLVKFFHSIFAIFKR